VAIEEKIGLFVGCVKRTIRMIVGFLSVVVNGELQPIMVTILLGKSKIVT
jgi:hypothetical protein